MLFATAGVRCSHCPPYLTAKITTQRSVHHRFGVGRSLLRNGPVWWPDLVVEHDLGAEGSVTQTLEPTGVIEDSSSLGRYMGERMWLFRSSENIIAMQCALIND